MSYTVAIKAISASEPLMIKLQPGRLTFVMGANGTGKSTLMDFIAKQHKNHANRIYAHRLITLDSNSISFSGTQRVGIEGTLRDVVADPSFRYRNPYANQTVNTVLYDIHAAETSFTSKQLQTLKAADPETKAGIDEWHRAKQELSPIKRLERILKGAGLQFSLSVDTRGTITVSKEGHDPYGVQELSDGERAAFLLAASVITAPESALILIDEPERHLHRSISSPLIHALLADRKDCTFVVSTHDVGLSLDQSTCSAILLREYRHDPQAWKIDFIENVEALSEDVAETILGSRQIILFVEGTRSSLDHSLYSHLYPGTSTKAAGSCADVINATRGVNETMSSHWVRAIGVIDRDRRTEEGLKTLEEQGIIALEVHAVESIYYHPKVIRRVALRLEQIGQVNHAALDSKLDNLLLNSFRAARDTLVQDATVRHVRNAVFSRLPKAKDLKGGIFPAAGLTAEEVSCIHAGEETRFDELINASDLRQLYAAYPIKRTGLIRAVCDILRLVDGDAYGDIVRKMVIDDAEAATELRRIIGPLTAKVGELKDQSTSAALPSEAAQ